jgi:uncharacterized membrane protein
VYLFRSFHFLGKTSTFLLNHFAFPIFLKLCSMFHLHQASTGAKIAGADTIIKTTLMVVYDQIWAKIQWGRELENHGGDGI